MTKRKGLVKLSFEALHDLLDLPGNIVVETVAVPPFVPSGAKDDQGPGAKTFSNVRDDETVWIKLRDDAEDPEADLPKVRECEPLPWLELWRFQSKRPAEDNSPEE